MLKDDTIIFAKPTQRFLAHLIDVLILSLITYILLKILSFSDIDRAIIFKEASYLIISALYYSYLPASHWQATIGKKIFKLKIVDYNLKKITVSLAFLRFFGYFFSYLTAGLGFLLMFFNSRSQNLQDFFAKTYVIRE